MWFKMDDGASEHDKLRTAAELAGPATWALWAGVGNVCAKNGTEGVAAPLIVKDAAYRACIPPDQLDKVTAALVTAGLWHDTKTLNRCGRCKSAVALDRAIGGRLPAAAYYFHDWLDYQFTRDETKIPEHRAKKLRGNRLKRDRRTCDKVVERDGTLCRYCGIRVNFADRVSGGGGTYDHVDPDGDNSVDNVVVACRDCNREKDCRTPAEAEMVLWPPRTSAADIAEFLDWHARATATECEALRAWSRSGPDQNGTKS